MSRKEILGITLLVLSSLFMVAKAVYDSDWLIEDQSGE